MKVPVHKIQSCFTTYVVVFVNYGCIIWVQMQMFWCVSCWLQRYPYPMNQSNQLFSCRCIKPSTNFIQSFFSQHIFSEFSYCLQWNRLLKTFSHSCTLTTWHYPYSVQQIIQCLQVIQHTVSINNHKGIQPPHNENVRNNIHICLHLRTKLPRNVKYL